MQKVVFILLCFALMQGFSISAGAEQNLLTNGDFEKVGPDQKPESWQEDCWQGTSVLTATNKKAHGGKYALMIKSDQENDARMIQVVKVKPHTYYRLSGWVASENIPADKTGASLGVVADFNFSRPVTGTTDWTNVEFNFCTDSSQTEVTVGPRLGMWGGTANGTAYYDDLSLVELANPPANFNQLVTQNSSDNNQAPVTKPADTQPTQSTPAFSFLKVGGGWLWFLLLLASILVIIWIIVYENKKKA